MNPINSPSIGRGLALFAVGALAGAGVALLYAPRSGKDTRKLIANRTRDLTNKASEAFEEAKDVVLEKKNAIAAAVEAGKDAFHNTRRA